MSSDAGASGPDHPIRARILEIVERCPGVHKRGVRDRLDINPANLEHHITVLEEVGELITREPNGTNQTVCFLARHTYLWTDKDTRVLWGRRPTRPVAAFVAEHPGSTSLEIAKAVGLSKRAARHHLRKLKSANLVVASRSGNRVTYEPVKKLVAWVVEHGEEIERPWTDRPWTEP